MKGKEKPVEDVLTMGDKPDIDMADRACPGCGYLVLGYMVVMAKFDYPCPRCGEHKLSDFVRVKK